MVHLAAYLPSPEGRGYSEIVCHGPRLGLTIKVIAKSNAIFLAGSFGRFNASGLPGVRSSGREPVKRLT